MKRLIALLVMIVMAAMPVIAVPLAPATASDAAFGATCSYTYSDASAMFDGPSVETNAETRVYPRANSTVHDGWGLIDLFWWLRK